MVTWFLVTLPVACVGLISAYCWGMLFGLKCLLTIWTAAASFIDSAAIAPQISQKSKSNNPMACRGVLFLLSQLCLLRGFAVATWLQLHSFFPLRALQFIT